MTNEEEKIEKVRKYCKQVIEDAKIETRNSPSFGAAVTMSLSAAATITANAILCILEEEKERSV